MEILGHQTKKSFLKTIGKKKKSILIINRTIDNFEEASQRGGREENKKQIDFEKIKSKITFALVYIKTTNAEEKMNTIKIRFKKVLIKIVNIIGQSKLFF